MGAGTAAANLTKASRFSTDCRRCDRLARHLDAVRAQYPEYHARPVPPFGVSSPRLLIVGLAPGMHGANRTGRPFTGDYAGILLFETLHRFGFANQADSVCRGDKLRLIGCRITNAVKCLPP
jgi:uracil-DNA glycosylase